VGSATALLVFVCGAFYEASCVGFGHFAESGGAWKTALMSSMAVLAEVTGIFVTVHDWRVGPLFVVGLGVGAFERGRLGPVTGRLRTDPAPELLGNVQRLNSTDLAD